MADEVMIVEKNLFEDEIRLLVACFICDENGVEIPNLKDFKEKGKSLKIITEEYAQEVALPGGRRYAGPLVNETIYWDPKVYYSENVTDLLVKRRDDVAILADMQRFAVDETEVVVYNDNITPSLSFNDKINDFDNNNIARLTTFKPSISSIAPPDPNAPPPDPLLPPAEPVYVVVPDENSPTTHVHLQVVDRYCSHDSFIDSPFSEVDTPDNRRKMGVVSEIYAKKFPAIRYNANPRGGLNAVILNLLNDFRLDSYKLDKLIIGTHSSPGGLQKFKPTSAYSIDKDTYKLIFSKFKSIEIINPLISVTFPEGEVIIDSLKVNDCKILANNSVIKVNSSLEMNNCTVDVNNSTNKVQHIVFNTKKDIDIKGITYTGPAKLSFICEGDGINAKFSDIRYNFDGSKLDSPILNTVGFTELKIIGIEKMDGAILSNIPILNSVNCINVSIMDMKTGNDKYLSNLLLIKGINDLSISEVTDNVGESGTFLNVSSTGTDASIKISKANIVVGKLMMAISSTIGSLSLADSTITVNKLMSKLETTITDFKLSGTTINFKEATDLILDKTNFDGSTINVDSFNITLNSVLTLNKTTINSKKLNILFKDVSKITSTDSFFNISENFDMIGVKGDSNASKYEIVKTTISGGNLSIKDVSNITTSYSYLENSGISIDNCQTFNSSDTIIRTDKMRSLSVSNITTIKQSTFFIENGIDLSLLTENCNGVLLFKVNAESKIKRTLKNCRLSETYTNTNDVKLSVIVNSSNCTSSAFSIDKKYLTISPLCDDFKLFKPAPENFKMTSAGKDLFKEIYYLNSKPTTT